MKNAKSVAVLVHNIRVFYLSSILKGVAIAIPHAILTLIFLEKGMSYSQIATIQAAYSIATIIFEFPSGVLADKYRKKNIFILSNLILAVSYVIVLVSDSFYMLMLAWLIYGMSNAFETGTVDADIIVMIKRICPAEERQSRIEKFLGRGNSLSGIAAILGAGAGFFLYQYIDIGVYHLMIVLMLISGIIVLLHYKTIETSDRSEGSSILQLVKETAAELKSSVELRWIVAAFGALQMYIQVHFQMWQAYFLEAGYPRESFLGLYLLFQLITILVYRFPVSKLFQKYLPGLAMLGIAASLLLYFTVNKAAVIILYCVPVVIVLMFQFFLGIVYNMKVREENISSLTSLNSTIMRCFSAVTLLSAGVIIEVFSLKTLYLAFAILTIAAVALISRKFTAVHPDAGGKGKT